MVEDGYSFKSVSFASSCASNRLHDKLQFLPILVHTCFNVGEILPAAKDFQTRGEKGREYSIQLAVHRILMWKGTCNTIILKEHVFEIVCRPGARNFCRAASYFARKPCEVPASDTEECIGLCKLSLHV
jgi:hypothetical protein